MRNYSRTTSPSTADQAMIWSAADSDWRLTPFGSVQELFERSSDAINEPVSEYLTPLDGFTYTLAGSADLHLIMTPAATLATGTLTLPVSPGTRDKQTVLVTSTEEVTALTVVGNGATLSGEPSTISAGGFFKMKYDIRSNIWHRVG